VQAQPVATPARRRHRRIEPSRGLIPIDLGELWQYRDLLYYFTWRDIKARYKQTFLGAFWAIFRPLVSMIMFAVIFGGLAGIKSGSSVPYPLFVYAGTLAWTYFSSALTSGSSSLLNNAGLMSKAYFPRLYAPIAAVTAPLVDFVLSMTIVFGLFAYFHRWPSWHMIFLPFFLLIAMAAGMGVGFWLSGATVRYRDVGFAMPFVIQIWMYATPIIYPSSLVPERWRWLLALNPVTAVVEGFRWSLFGTGGPHVRDLLFALAFTLAVAVPGLFFFRRTERTIVDAF
jgi:lipopolysaccharide transport system permease protein